METLLSLKIEKLVAGGLGLARDSGGVVLVRGALPSEEVLAEVRQGKGVRHAVAKQIVTASPDRVENLELPTADLAHASYSAQLSYKHGFVTEALSRIAKLSSPVLPVVPSPLEWNYRNTAQYLVTSFGLAYRERGAHIPKTFDQDPLIMPQIEGILKAIDCTQLKPATEIAFRCSSLTGQVLAALIGEGETRNYLHISDHLMDAGVAGVSLSSPSGKRFSAGSRLIAGESYILEQFGDVKASISAIGFAQVNPYAAGLAYKSAMAMAGNGDHAADLYGGSGIIARHLAPNFRRVTVLDASAEALERGRLDTEQDQKKNIRFRHGDAALLNDIGADVIVVDPPRAGLSEATRDEIVGSTADRLVYMSCDPATWARDVGELTRRGWKIHTITPHDFYPQTSHVEILSLLER